MKTPYQQQDKHGTEANPNENKYSNKYSNRKQKRENKGRRFRNKKGIQLITTQIGRGKFIKYRKTLQIIGNKTIVHYTEVKR